MGGREGGTDGGAVGATDRYDVVVRESWNSLQVPSTSTSHKPKPKPKPKPEPKLKPEPKPKPRDMDMMLWYDEKLELDTCTMY